jgi:imidazoleglycerol-phosphate dehydratase/histidinol-phosphatase
MRAATLFIDRDGTLIEEPPDEQVDDLGKVRFLPGVFAALSEFTRRGYRLVMVTNQDGLGTERFPRAAFEACHEFVLETFRSQGVIFDAVFVCPHCESDGCACRKPQTSLLEGYLRQRPIDPERSAVIGDRVSDLALAANLNIRGFTVCRQGAPEQSWPSVLEALTARRAKVVRKTKETRIEVCVNLDKEIPLKVTTGIGFFNHMLEQLARHGGFALELRAEGDLGVDEHHTVEDSALTLGEALRQALGDKAGIARYGFVLPMDEAQVSVSLDLSGRAYSQFQGRFPRDQVGALPTELVPHFFRSLSETLKATLHVSVSGENTHHMVEACFKGVGRALRQAFRLEGCQLPSTKGTL